MEPKYVASVTTAYPMTALVAKGQAVSGLGTELAPMDGGDRDFRPRLIDSAGRAGILLP